MRLRVVTLLTLLMTGRAMTITFIGRAGDGGPGDPPAAWLMPLVGDAVVGVAALVLAVLIWRRRSPGVWLAAVVFHAIAVFDALAAYLVEVQVPWPDFFMIELIGRSMFFVAAVMGVTALYLLLTSDVVRAFGVHRGQLDGRAISTPAD